MKAAALVLLPTKVQEAPCPCSTVLLSIPNFRKTSNVNDKQTDHKFFVFQLHKHILAKKGSFITTNRHRKYTNSKPTATTMVTSTTQLKISSKGQDKLPHSASKAKVDSSPSKHSVSPDQSDELDALRARNKVLTNALQHIQESAKSELQHKYDLVWYAKYRCKLLSLVALFS